MRIIPNLNNLIFELTRLNQVRDYFWKIAFVFILFITSCRIGSDNIQQTSSLILSIGADHPELLRAENLIDNFEFKAAIDLFDQVILKGDIDTTNLGYRFLRTKLNYALKKHQPSLSIEMNSEGIDCASEQECAVLEVIKFLCFEFKNKEEFEIKISNYEKDITIDSEILIHAYFVLAEYYQTKEYDEDKAISYSNKIIELREANKKYDLLYFRALENLVILEVVNRDKHKSSVYAETFLDSSSVHHPKNKFLKSKGLCLKGYVISRLRNPKSALEYLEKSLKNLPNEKCNFYKQEIFKMILFVYNNFDLEDGEQLYQKYIDTLEKEIAKCGDYANINKIKGFHALNDSNLTQAIPLLHNAYDYILNNKPFNNAQFGSIVYYLYDSYLNEGNYDMALNTLYSETLMPIPKKIVKWDKEKLFSKRKKEFTFYFMNIGYYSRVFFEKYKAEKDVSDLYYSKTLLDSSIVLIEKETRTKDRDKLLSTFKNSEEVYGLGVLINAELYKLTGDENYLNELYQCSEENKLKILYSLMQSKADKRTSISKIQKVIDSLILTNSYTQEVIDKKKELEKIEGEIQFVKEENLFSKVQKGMDENELIIDYNIVGDELLAHYIYKDSSKIYSIDYAGKKQIIQDLIEYQQDENSDTLILNDYAKEVYSLLFPTNKLPYQITIIPDELLMNLNFEILRNEDSQLMIDHHLISYSGSGIQYVSNNTLNNKPSEKVVAFFFSNEETISNPKGGQDELAGNVEEKKAILEKYKEAKIFSGKENTKKRFLKVIEKERYKIIHIGTHGFSSKEDDKNIKLYFRDKYSQLDSTYAYHLLDKSVDADLVILSACDSGAGLNYSGEGKFDLARYFILSGAQSVISSLWAVEDGASKLIFDFFYSAKEGSNREKIRAAKIRLKSKPKYSHPYSWGSFVYSR